MFAALPEIHLTAHILVEKHSYNCIGNDRILVEREPESIFEAGNLVLFLQLRPVRKAVEAFI